jgi:uncharacterized protein YaaW (UPF0174 family)
MYSGMQDFEKITAHWSDDDFATLLTILAQEEKLPSRPVALGALYWTYNSKAVAGGKKWVSEAVDGIRSKLDDSDYEQLLRECSKKLGIENAESAPSLLLEMYFCETLISRSLAAMTAEQRHKAFTTKIDFSSVVQGSPGNSMTGSMTTFAALGVAQVSGFGVYMAATTALGFVTQAIGITLPFAIYTGLTSTIAFLIGPPGFLAVGFWAAFQLTRPEWKKLIPAMCFVIYMKNREAYYYSQLGAGTGIMPTVGESL